ncbi:MAG TPA: hypothetical protein VHM02_16325 [Thermoanaerobaculia bacterium]|nr:hypothetical protein [Thermoanaerobaculia bacterium]
MSVPAGRALRLGIVLAAALAAFFAAHLLRGYHVPLAAATGAAVGLLAFATVRTVDRMRRQLRR